MTTPDPTDRFFAPADDLVTRLASRESRAHAEAMIAKELAAAYAAGQAEALAWRPIETAPRDGSRVLLLMKGQPFIGWYSANIHAPWQSYGHMGRIWDTMNQPTAWAPLPPPHAAEPAREDGA